VTVPNGNLTLAELQSAAEEMCQRWWNVSFTGEIAIVNYRWTRMRGQFRYWRNEPGCTLIRLSSKMNDTRTREEVLGTLLHELVHWRLYTTGRPCSDRDFEFVAECLRVGAPISEATAAQHAYSRYLKTLEVTKI